MDNVPMHTYIHTCTYVYGSVCIVSKAIGAWGVIQSICVGVYCSDTHTHTCMDSITRTHTYACMCVYR